MEITINIDQNQLGGYTDGRLALAWHVAQANPAPFGDYEAGELVEHIAREIVRRFLKTTAPELWHHQGSHTSQNALSEIAKFLPVDGAGAEAHPTPGDPHSWRRHRAWVVKPEVLADSPEAAAVVTAALEFARARAAGGAVGGIHAGEKLDAAYAAYEAAAKAAAKPAGGEPNDSTTPAATAGER